MNSYNDWNDFLEKEFRKDYFKELMIKLEQDEKQHIVYPKKEDRFNAFKLTNLPDVKVVILGQDPYINENQAMGLSFSIPKGEKIPPSLKNIFKEIENSTFCEKKTDGDLTYLANQGVFLLNCVLTVRKGQSNSHKNYGYKTFANNVIEFLNLIDRPIVFMLWGNFAKEKASLITNKNHLVLNAVHPSPLAGNKFLGCNHFVLANEFLEKNGLKSINW